MQTIIGIILICIGIIFITIGFSDWDEISLGFDELINNRFILLLGFGIVFITYGIDLLFLR